MHPEEHVVRSASVAGAIPPEKREKIETELNLAEVKAGLGPARIRRNPNLRAGAIHRLVAIFSTRLAKRRPSGLRRCLLVAVGLLTMASTAMGVSSVARAGVPSRALPQGSSAGAAVAHGPAILWGASIGPQLTGGEAPYDAATIPAFEREVGKKLSIVGMGWPFAGCSGSGACVPYPFPSQGLDDIRVAGAIPVVSFQTEGTGGYFAKDPITLQGIIAGRWDAYLESYGQEIKAYVRVMASLGPSVMV